MQRITLFAASSQVSIDIIIQYGLQKEQNYFFLLLFYFSGTSTFTGKLF
jgi:hypothetical protein